MSPNLSIYALSGKAKTTEFQSKLNSLESERKETKETTLVLKYNQAVILFHQQQFQKSIDILNELKKKIREEPVSFIQFIGGTTLDCIIKSLVGTHESATSGFEFNHIRV